MNYKVYKALKEFAEHNSLTTLSKYQVYIGFEIVSSDFNTHYNFGVFLSSIKNREYSGHAVEMLMAGLQEFLPERKEKLSEQIDLLKSKAADPELSEILDYLEYCRNHFTHYGIVPKFKKKPDLFDAEDINDKYFALGCLILYAVFRCHVLYIKPPRFEKWEVFMSRFRMIISHSRIPRLKLTWLDHFLQVTGKTAVGAVGIAIISLMLIAIPFVANPIGTVGRKIASHIKQDEMYFRDMSSDEIKDYVMNLSKAERSYYISKRLRNLDKQRNYYRVGEPIRCADHTATKELYDMAKEEMLPNAYNFWGALTKATMSFSHIPVLKVMSEFPSKHRYMESNKRSKRKIRSISKHYDLVSQYYYCGLTCSGNSVLKKDEEQKVRNFAKEISKRAKVEYLIIGYGNDCKDAVNSAKSALRSAGVQSHRIKIIYDEIHYGLNASIRVKIL